LDPDPNPNDLIGFGSGAFKRSDPFGFGFGFGSPTLLEDVADSKLSYTFIAGLNRIEPQNERIERQLGYGSENFHTNGYTVLVMRTGNYA